jgi:hemoglobin
VTDKTFYEEVGGHAVIADIIHRFYAGVADDPELRALYPEAELGPAEHRLTMFFEQYWGGPTTYSDERGHPRLGMRHARFAVTPTQAGRWLGHMRTALTDAGLDPDHVEQFWAYVTRAAHFLVNTPDEESPAGDEDGSATRSPLGLA